MKKFRLVFISIILIAAFQIRLFAQSNEVKNYDPVKAAYGVLNRLLPAYAKDFQLKYVSAERGNDEFEVEAENGMVKVSGNSAIALTRGIYHYLRYGANCQVTWSGDNLDLPKKLPDFSDTKIITPYKYRLYYNVCTFGYTTAFWDWKQWQKEIDWMALHGINMPLSMIGKEAVWRKVWKKFGITDAELENYFTGPAFLPWHQMGNINKHGGPIPENYFEKSVALQKKILERMRELGMDPIVPAFSGYVPKAFTRIFPDEKLIAMQPWAGFSPDDGTYMLSPLSKHFSEIGKEFIKEYQKEYGKNHFYLADAFNEMTVPVSQSERYKELTDFGSAIYKSITAGDPTGVWVMQGWLFYNDQKFWDKPSVKAFLKEVPNNKMIIIDLANEYFHGWKKLDGFFGKQWIFSIIHNFGGHNQLFGNLPRYSNDAADVLTNSNHGNLVGFGLSPEGIENNDVVYELLTDLAWKNKPLNLNKWIEQYCISRYGKYPPAMKKAWEDLLKSVYSNPNSFSINFYQVRPRLKGYKDQLSSNYFDTAAENFLACSEELKNSKLYTDDAIQIAVQYAGFKVDSLLNLAIEFHQHKNFSRRDKAFKEAFELLNKMDQLLADHPLYNLKRWIDFARSWGTDPQEKNYYEENAKRQITTWGGSELSEYAAKVWHGLIKDYYLPRWERFADSLETGSSYDIYNWEEKWISTPTKNFDNKKVMHPIVFAKDLMNKADNYTKELK